MLNESLRLLPIYPAAIVPIHINNTLPIQSPPMIIGVGVGGGVGGFGGRSKIFICELSCTDSDSHFYHSSNLNLAGQNIR